MEKLVFVLNCGSSSIKAAVLEPVTGKEYLSLLAEKLGLEDASIKWKQNGEKQTAHLPANCNHKQALDFIITEILKKDEELFNSISAIGHRVVHGWEKFTSSVVVTPEVISELKSIIDFAPLHNPAHIAWIEAAIEELPHLAEKNVLVFDTAFHQTIEEKAFLYAIPYSFYKEHGIRRYGFHGTSHYFISTELAKYLNKDVSEVNLINCHLWNGASVCAIKNGKSVETSMWFTPLEGLVMWTRSWDLDPAIIRFLNKKFNYTFEEVDDILNKKSGLLGLTEVTSDCRFAEDNYEKEVNATRAIDVFCHRLAKYIWAYMAVMDVDHLDAITFTGWIGENSALIREKTINSLRLMGYKIDTEKNLENRFGKMWPINAENTPLVMVIPTNEEVVIARDTLNLVK